MQTVEGKQKGCRTVETTSEKHWVVVPKIDLRAKWPQIVELARLDDAPVEWVITCQEKRISLSWQIRKKKSERLTNGFGIPGRGCPTFTDGRLEKFL